MAFSTRATIEPNKADLGSMESLLDVLAWSKLDGAVAVGLLIALGADADSAIHEVASIGPDDFEDGLTVWRIDVVDENARAPTPMEKGRARTFIRACRLAAHLEWSAEETDAWNWEEAQRGAKAEEARTAAILAASVGHSLPPPVMPPAVRSVKVSEIADVTKTIEAPVLADCVVSAAFKTFKAKMWTNPRPEQEPTTDQLSALADLLAHHSCYVDLSIWGPHGMRILKKMKVAGLIMVGQGEFAPHEYRGPPDYEHWLACWEVYQTAMIMLDACSPPYLLAYAALIGHYNKRYGARCWALIYQMESRFRKETMERGRRQANDDLDEAIARGGTHPFDPARPWEYIFKMATEGGASEAKYWHINIEEPCVLIIAGRYSTAEFLEGDAPVCAASSAHIATAGTPGSYVVADNGGSAARRPPAQQPPPKRQATVDRAPKQQLPPRAKTGPAIEKDGKYVTNRVGNYLCINFNAGMCPAKKGAHVCPKDDKLRHNCNLCLSSSHGANTCTVGKTDTKAYNKAKR
jgi:hypothetical protein